jgi:putative addiction module component (TIGR02574 family)
MLKSTEMMDPARNVLEAALKLDEAEQEEIVEALAANLYGADLGPEWEAEIQRRIAEVERGNVALVPGDEVFARLERKFGRG